MPDATPLPEWLQAMRQGDPIEVTIRGRLSEVRQNFAGVLLRIEYGSAEPLIVTLPLDPAVTLRTFVASEVVG